MFFLPLIPAAFSTDLITQKTSHEIYWTMVLETEQAPTNTIVQ